MMSDAETRGARIAIRSLVEAYSGALNARRWVDLGHLFSDDAVFATHGVLVDREAMGRAAIVKEIASTAARMRLLIQRPQAPLIAALLPDRATARVQVHVLGVQADGAYEMFGAYEDSLVRADGNWLFGRRAFTALYRGPAAPACPDNMSTPTS